MLRRTLRTTLFALIGTCSVCSGQVAVQKPDSILPDGSAYLWVEAESATIGRLDGAEHTPGNGLMKVDKLNPIQTITVDPNDLPVTKGGLDVLPADTNASGGAAIFHNWPNDDGAVPANLATAQVQFAIPATYYLYLRYSMYNRDSNNNYLNEDSIYVAPAFNKNPTDDWIGHEGTNFSFDPEEGNSNRDGWMPLHKDIYSKGELVGTHDSTDEDFWDGQFHWAIAEVAVNMDENNAWVNDDGLRVLYDVADTDVDSVLDYQIATREQYGAIDGFLFATSNELLFEYSQEEMDDFFVKIPTTGRGDFNGDGVLDAMDIDELTRQSASGGNDVTYDLTGDGVVDAADVDEWISAPNIYDSWLGDANLDKEFNSGDLVTVLAAGVYESDTEAVWSSGDFDGSGRNDTNDLVAALSGGGYENGVRPATAAVPEPSTLALLLIGSLAVIRRRRS